MKKLFLVDAYALIFKYYYAFLGRPMRNRAGMNTSVVFGFVKFLRDIQKRERPDLLGVAFDPKGGSFRREIFPEYKANRAETPEDILLSVPYVKRVLEAMCIPILEVEGYEADDVIGTLSQKGVEAGYEVFMVTPDKDYGQLVRDNCKIYKQKGAEGSIEIETLIGKGSKQLTMDLVNVERVKEYAAEDADVTLQLKHVLYPQVEKMGLQHLYFEVEEPMIAVLADIEMAGVRIDSGALAEYSVELSRRLAELEAAIRAEAGESTLNINSARQLGEVLFAKMRIAEKPKMTKTKQFCTDEDYLQTFARKHRIVDLILEYRGVKKLLSTYVEALPQLVNRTTGRIHTSFNQAVTATGRLSSTNPNLQNIPVREEMGRRIRRAFIPSDSDHLLLSADYSQVELRLMAHLSGDESLIAAFAHGEDIHAATAAKLFNKTLDEVTSEERRRAKTANFGIIYGISAFGLSQRLEIPRKEAKDIIDGYFESYPKVKEYMDNVVARAKEEGFVSTIFGRRRYLNDISSHNAVARGLAERNAVNAPIQGSAADIMKIAMINVHRRFAAEGIRSKVILQVHDELVVDMLRSEQERVAAIVTECMESAAALKVRLVVDYGVGDNWLEAH